MKPFDHNKFLGYVVEVAPSYVKVQIPSSHLMNSFYYEGDIYESGVVGSFVIVEGQDYGFLCRLIEVGLPQGEKAEITENRINDRDTAFHPVGKIEILGMFDVYKPELLNKTVSRYPRVGAKVYACSDEQIGVYISKFGNKENESNTPYAKLGTLTSNNSVCNISLNSLFGRHCAVLGTTGGGKSWTVASLLESLNTKTKNKAILIDATGEYNGMPNMLDVSMGDGTHVFPYQHLTIDELYFLLHPSSKTQVPKLMEAIRSLKVAKLDLKKEAGITYDSHGNIVKAGKKKRPFEVFYYRHVSDIESKSCDFDFLKLARQITQECVWDVDKADTESWGGRNETDISNCISLISRVNNLINTDEYNKVFGFKPIGGDTPKNLVEYLEEFLNGDKQILRIDFSHVSFDYQVREILVDAIGRYLLQKARHGDFKSDPLIVFIDEAHQFLNKQIADEYFMAKQLDAFEQISKEARKYGLFICIATQMPRDVPIATLSQMGSFIVHRLINEQDKRAVENAASAANKNILSFLPILGEGEAVIVGVDFPMPLLVKIEPPKNKPRSQTPRLVSK